MNRRKIALVTGSTSGIGLGIARALARNGNDVMINGFGKPQDIAAVSEELRSFGVRIAYSPADLQKPSEIVEMVEAANTRLGAVDILINNAGIQRTGRIESLSPENWDSVIAVNLSANFHTIRAVLPPMREQNWGRIVNIASVHGLVASVDKSAYVAAKHGVVGLTKAVGLETATTGITCNAICPGWILTPLVEQQVSDRARRDKVSLEEAKAELLFEKQPSGEFATPDQIGALTVFLCSEDASQIRGASLPVDGAWLAQ